jgi:hypothetical protein
MFKFSYLVDIFGLTDNFLQTKNNVRKEKKEGKGLKQTDPLGFA